MKRTKIRFYVVNELGGIPEVYVYGYIGDDYDDLESCEFAKRLSMLGSMYPQVNLRINSPGGSIYEGIAFRTAIKNCKAKVVAYIDGIAASMAAVLALQCAGVYMNRYGRMMTHRAQGGAYGTANELRAAADNVQSLEDDLCQMIASRTKQSAEDCRNTYLTNTDKWITADEALAVGLIDGIFDGEQVQLPAVANNTATVWNAYSGIISNHFNGPKEDVIILI